MNIYTAFVSICIPAYKRINFLQRLLNSIAGQAFRDFEVIVTDDSPDDKVEQLCKGYESLFHLRYYKNAQSLGTPENWNEAIRKANGQWIKIMHDDDWFAEADALEQFVKAIKANPGATFFFCAYANVYEKSGRVENVYLNPFRKKALLHNPATLIARNVIGQPSVVLHRNDPKYWYDRNVKWVVDIDFYIRCLKDEKPVYIPRKLVNLGMHGGQVTTYTFGVPEVHLCENLYLLNKIGETNLRNVLIFDAWWRMIRNFSIRDAQQIEQYCKQEPVPIPLRRMIRFQKNFSASLLRQGVFSKFFMFVCYVFFRLRKWL